MLLAQLGEQSDVTIDVYLRAPETAQGGVILASHPKKLTPLNMHVDSYGGPYLFVGLARHAKTISLVGFFAVVSDMALAGLLMFQPLTSPLLISLGTTAVAVPAAYVGIRERVLQNRLKPWIQHVTAAHMRAWLRSERGIKVAGAFEPKFDAIADILNAPDRERKNIIPGRGFEDTSGNQYRAQINMKTDQFEIVDAGGNDITSKKGWARHQQALSQTSASKPNPTGEAVKISMEAPPEPNKVSILDTHDRQRILTATRALTGLLNRDLDVETRHTLERTIKLVEDLAKMDNDLAHLSPVNQRAGLPSLRATLQVIEAEIKDLSSITERSTLRQARILAGYAANIRANKTVDPRLSL